MSRLFCFTEDYGAREDLSILHERILVVTDGPDMGKALTAHIATIIGDDPRRGYHQFDKSDDTAEPRVVKALSALGYTSEFRDIEAYVNE